MIRILQVSTDYLSLISMTSFQVDKESDHYKYDLLLLVTYKVSSWSQNTAT